MLLLKILMTLAVLWHSFAFAAGGVYAFLAYRSLFDGRYDRRWTRVIRSADWQLWVSGSAIIVLGIASSGSGLYMANPKLWTKLLVVATWLVSTQFLRHIGVRHSRAGNRRSVLIACALNVACWIYGAFLGVAKPLADGSVPFSAFLTGFIGVATVSIGLTLLLEKKHRRAPFSTGGDRGELLDIDLQRVNAAPVGDDGLRSAGHRPAPRPRPSG